MKYLKIFEDFERSAYTKISPKTLSRGNQYLQEICPLLNLDLYEEVLVMPGGNFLYNEIEYDSIESLIKEAYEKVLSIWNYRRHYHTINNGLIDVHEDIDIMDKELTKIPYKFGKVDGKFVISVNKITTLKGAPHRVGGNFQCSRNELITLQGAPHTVGGDFRCRFNKLVSLKGGPLSVGNSFDCGFNNLTSLEGAPKSVSKDFVCDKNQLSNLKYISEEIGGYIYCNDNPNLTDFSDVPLEYRKKLADK